MTKKVEEISPEIRLQIIQQEHQMWANTREMFTIRHRVYKRLNDSEGIKAAEKELEKCETALDELDKILL